MTGGELVVRTLLEQGVQTVFGIPGALNAHLYDALARCGGDLRHVLVRHELGAAWMADGYARASGEAGVALTVPGPGATHAASGVAGAYTDCSRLLVISTQSERAWRGELRRDLFHGLDQQRLFAAITKWQGAAHTADAIAPLLEEAFRRVRTGRPGPVRVEIAADVLGMETTAPVPGRVTALRPEADPAAVARAAAVLRAAARPLILAGDGVLHSEATEALGLLAERLGAPVITTVMGKGALPDDHPWSLGDMNSAAGSAGYVAADLLLAVGARFVQLDTRWPWFRPPTRLVHVDADRREIGRVFPAEIGLAGDPRAVLGQLLAEADDAGAPADRWPDLEARRRAHSERTVFPLLGALRAVLPRNGIAVFDVCYPGFLSRAEWTTWRPRDYQYPGVYVGMGFGLPAGIGAALARPGDPVLVVAGDAGFQMTMAEIGTAVQHGVPLVVVVVNDGGLELIRRVQDRGFGGRRYAVDLVNPDFAALARAYGIDGTRVTDLDSLAETVALALRERRLAVIEYLPDHDYHRHGDPSSRR